MDSDGNSVLTPKELQDFMSSELTDGRDIMSGQMVLPSGRCLSLGALIDIIRRQKVMDSIIKVISIDTGGMPYFNMDTLHMHIHNMDRSLCIQLNLPKPTLASRVGSRGSRVWNRPRHTL